MKYILSLCLFYLIVCLPVHAQLANKQEVLYEHFLTGKELKGMVYEFEERIDNFHLDSIRNTAVVQLRGLTKRKKKPRDIGALLFLDFTNDSIVWQRKLPYEVIEIQCDRNIIFKHKKHNNKTYLLDPASGSVTKELAHDVFYISEDNIGLGYKKIPSNKTDSLYGIDMNANSILWSRKINRKFGINEIFPFNDSTVLLSASGLHTVNLNNGQGWSMDAVTGKEVKSTATYVGIGLAFGVIGVSVMAAIDGMDDREGKNMQVRLYGMESNILLDGEFIYYASKDEVFKVDRKGDLIWKKDVRGNRNEFKERNSRSFISLQGDDLLVIGRGVAFSPKKQIKHGTPRFSSYDKHTGECKSNFLLKRIVNGPVLDYKSNNNSIGLLTRDTLMEVMSNNNVKRLSLSFKKKGRAIGFLENNQFIAVEDSILVKISDVYPENYHVLTSKGIVYRIDENLEIQEHKNKLNYWSVVGQFQSYTVLSLPDTILIINEYGKKIATFSNVSNSCISKNMLYLSEGNKLKVIDLESLLN